MSKYDPLKLHLCSWHADRAPMTFSQIEALLGFPLPRSAREHQAWWANTEGTHSHARSWLGAGWRTSDLDIVGERVIFVRGVHVTEPRRAPINVATQIAIPLESLSPRAIQLINERANAAGLMVAEAAAEFLNEAAGRRRAELVAEFAGSSPELLDDSVDLIREDRNAR